MEREQSSRHNRENEPGANQVDWDLVAANGWRSPVGQAQKRPLEVESTPCAGGDRTASAVDDREEAVGVLPVDRSVSQRPSEVVDSPVRCREGSVWAGLPEGSEARCITAHMTEDVWLRFVEMQPYVETT